MKQKEIKKKLTAVKEYLDKLNKNENISMKKDFLEKVKINFSKNLDIFESVYQELESEFPTFKSSMLKIKNIIDGTDEEKRNSEYLSIYNELYLQIIHNIHNQLYFQILTEDIKYIIRRYPIMAYHKSNYLKILYKEMEKYIKDENTPLKEMVCSEKLNGRKFYRGRLFKKTDKNPFEENPLLPAKSLFQSPVNVNSSEGRFNITGKSNFYLSDSKLGVYLETRKYKIENKEKTLYLQQFKINNEIDDVFFKVMNEIREEILEYFDESSNYSVSNYISAMAKSLNFRGVYYTGVRQNMFDSSPGKYLGLNNNSTYHNLTIFSSAFSEEHLNEGIKNIYDIEKRKEMTRFYKILKEKKDNGFFCADDNISYLGNPEVFDIYEVIEEFNKIIMLQELSFLDIHNQNYLYEFKMDFELLNRKSNEYINIEDIFKININIDEVYTSVFDNVCRELKTLINNGKNVSTIIDFGKNTVQEDYFDILKMFPKFRNPSKSELTDFILNFSKDFSKIDKIDFTITTKIKIIEEYLENFHNFFEVYFNLVLSDSKNHIKLIKI